MFARAINEHDAWEMRDTKFRLAALAKIVGKRGLPLLEAGKKPPKGAACAIGFRRQEASEKMVYLHQESFVASFDENLQRQARRFLDDLKVEPSQGKNGGVSKDQVLQAGLPRRRYMRFSNKATIAWRNRMRDEMKKAE